MSLFDRGSQPDVVVLAISPTRLVQDRPPTGTSDRVFEHVSEFFAIRSRLRQDARRLIVPGYERMSRQYFIPAADAPDTARDGVISEARLRARAGVPVVVAVSNDALEAAWLLDGYHLNVAGASASSARAGVALAAELAPKTSPALTKIATSEAGRRE